eukprot:COSAG06_NODE_22413_length_724_cov_1.068800_1_plen_52_part_10
MFIPSLSWYNDHLKWIYIYTYICVCVCVCVCMYVYGSQKEVFRTCRPVHTLI